jgi:DNA-binding NarL/FixJ family response regulator
MTTRVLVIAPSPMVRAGLASLVNSSPALEVVGSLPVEAGLARQIEELQPDVVLVELERRGDAAAASILNLEQGQHAPAVVALTDETEGAHALEQLRSGVRALLPREATSEEIVAAVEAAAAGLFVLHAEAFHALVSTQAVVPHVPNTSTQDALTPREVEVLGMIAEGLGNKIIAWRLGISEHTVKFHVSSIFAKLNASSRTEAVTLGIRHGLIML